MWQEDWKYILANWKGSNEELGSEMFKSSKLFYYYRDRIGEIDPRTNSQFIPKSEIQDIITAFAKGMKEE